MIKEDDGGGMAGMAVDGMGGMGFTDTGNIAGIALGMHPVDKKKKKKKKHGEVVMEDILSLIEADIKSMASPAKTSLFSGRRYIKSRTNPETNIDVETGERLNSWGVPIKTSPTEPSVKGGDKPEPPPEEENATTIKNDQDVHESATSIDPMPSPYYTPLFNDSRNIGTIDQAHELGLPRATRGVRRRAVLAAILGGL